MQMAVIFRTLVTVRLAFVMCLVLAAPGLAQDTANSMPGFNHTEESGFPLNGRHTEIFCEACHIDNQLEGTPRSCVSCHNGSRAKGKPAAHPPAGSDCAQCHTTANFVPFDFDHTQITQDCTTCHTGSGARGMPGDHIPIKGSCDDCHVTTGFTDVRVEHASVVGECASCHKPGGVAPAQPKDHIPVPANANCGDCHSTFRFAGAIFDHMAVDQPCASCHNNSLVIGKPVDHIPAPETCNDCHTPFFEESFTTVQLDHSVVPGDCASCHFPGNPWDAPYKPASHPPNVGEDCESCHSTFAFSIGRQFDHAQVMGACSDCHFIGNGFGAPTILSADARHANILDDDCSQCHTTTGFDPYVSFPLPHGGAVVGSCAVCHEDADPFGNAPGPSDGPSQHSLIVTNSCEDCHLSSSFTALSVSPIPHADIMTAGNCDQCHTTGSQLAGASTQSTAAMADSRHSQITSTECDTCHTSTSVFTSLVGVIPHTSVTGTCVSCHSFSSQFDGADGQPSWHVGDTSTTCDNCHSTGSSFSATLSMSHSDPGATDCQDCHDPDRAGSSNYSTATKRPHEDRGQCSGCHNTTSFP